MRKKLIYGLCTLFMMACLVACGSDKEATYGGYKSDDFKKSVEESFNSLNSKSNDQLLSDINTCLQYGDEISAAYLSDFVEVREEIGQFNEFKDFELTKSGKTLTATLTANYTNRDVRVIWVFNVNKIDEGPTAANVEIVYTLGEIMKTAALNTIMGIAIVFIMLIVMCVIIAQFKRINDIQKKLENKNADVSTDSAVSTVTTASVTASDDLELIAVIAAAIAASTGASTDSFVVRSIKKRH
ncbi:MAG: OadG family protein [Pseudobutyrivibrio sp.]|nr:OadG family protein [Pseudobutyrivibrio sp.]